MNEQEIYGDLQSNNAKENNFNSLKLFLSQCLYHWPLFVLGVIICVGIAYYKIKTTKPTYLANARILVNVSKSSETPTLQILNAANTSKGTDNEIEIIKSISIITQAVNDLDLWVKYEQVGKYYENDLYGNSPFKFKLLKNAKVSNTEVFELFVLSKDRFDLLKSDGSVINASFSNVFKNPFGEWKLIPASNITSFIGKKIRITVSNPVTVANAFKSQLVAQAPTTTVESNMVMLGINDEVPQRGKDFLDALIKNYINATKENKNISTANALKFLNTRLAELSQELNEAERKTAGYKSTNQFTDISAKGGAYLGNVQSNDSKLSELNLQLDLLSGVENYVNSSRNDGNAPTTTGITDPSIGGLVGQLSVAIQQRNKLLATTPESNPIFEPINKQISSIKEAIKEAIRSVRTSLNTTKRQLLANNSKFESSFKEVPAQEKEFVSLTRQKSLKEAQYLQLSQQKETIALNYAGTLSDVQVIDEPHNSGLTPSKAPIFITCAFLLGLIIPAGFVYGRNAVKNQITDKREIENLTNVPVITEINYDEDSTLVSILGRSGNILGEQIRELRTKLSYLHQKKTNGRVTLLTSSTSAEGKSFISSNLGVAIAASGKKVIILELDMRKPKISKTFGLNPDHLGISDYLSGKISDINSIIQVSNLNPNLFIIGAGTSLDNPAELLENFRMQEIIEFLRTSYENILLDTPPVHLVTDAFIISDLCDVTLYIVRQGYTSKEELEFMNRVVRDRRLPRMSVVFNGIQNDKFGNSYHYDDSYYTQTKKSTVKSTVKSFFARF